MWDKVKSHQQKIALGLGFIAVASLGFLGGREINHKTEVNQITQTTPAPINYTPEAAASQTTTTAITNTEPATPQVGDCEGKIKGSSSHIYHLPGGAFYNKTTHPIACFDTEAAAVSAGFRKSAR